MTIANFEHKNRDRYSSPDHAKELCPDGKLLKPSLRTLKSVDVQILELTSVHRALMSCP